MDDLKNKIEAILFASGKGISEEKLAEYCEEKIIRIKKTVSKLAEEYQSKDSSLIISKHQNKWKMTVRGKYTKYIEQLVSEVELPRTILKTLSLIAYKSPVLQSDIINMRGQSAYEHIKELVKEKLITKDESGRSYILKITDKFYNYFDIEGDEEIKELFENLRKKKEELIELEIINATEEEKKEEQQKLEKLGQLEIVDAENSEEITPRRKEKTEEEKEEEHNFLQGLDERINQISKKISNHQIIKETENKEITKKETEEKVKNEEKININKENEQNRIEEKTEKEEEEIDYI